MRKGIWQTIHINEYKSINVSILDTSDLTCIIKFVVCKLTDIYTYEVHVS